MSDNVLGFCIVAAGIAIGSLMVYAAIQDGRDWEHYSVTHHCKESGYMTGSSVPVVGFNSSGGTTFGIASTPSKTRYTCDNGKEIWR